MGRKKKPGSKNYFTKDTELAIIEYLASEDERERNKIYNERLHYAFYKLAENIIHTFKFYYTEVDDLEDLKHEMIILILEKLHMWNPDAGFKAYSYFSIVVKNYLIAYNNKNYKKKKITTDLIAADSDVRVLDNIENNIKRLDKKNFLAIFVNYMLGEADRLYPEPLDNHIAHSILYLLEQRDQIEIPYKKAIYIYIRDMTGCETPSITKIVKRMEKHYYSLYNQYEMHGDIQGI